MAAVAREALAITIAEEAAKSVPFPLHRRAVRDNGRAFTRLVLSAHSQGRVANSDVSNLLGVKLKHLPKIDAAVFPTPRDRAGR